MRSKPTAFPDFRLRNCDRTNSSEISKAQIAQRVFEHERGNPRRSATIAATANVEQNVAVLNNADDGSTAPSIEEPIDQPFSSGQLNQLRQLIAEAVGSEHRAPVLANSNAPIPLLSPTSSQADRPQLPQELAGEGNQDGFLSPVYPGPRPPTGNAADVSTAPLPLALAPIIPGNHPPANVTDPGLPSLPQKLRNKIIKREYIDFNDLFSSNLYPVHSSATSNNFTLALNPQDTSTLAFVPTQQRKRRIDGQSSWMEAWNVCLRTLLASYPHLAPDFLAYQAQICKFSRKFKSTAWLMYDTAFRHMAASNVLAPWSKVNEQLYSDILKEETLPYCISCHTYGHRTLACPARSISNLAAQLKNHLLYDLQWGCNIGYSGPRLARVTSNLKSALLQPQAVSDALEKELLRGHTTGPFSEPPIPILQCSSLGVVPKKDGTWRIIMDLSSPAWFLYQ